MNAHHPSPDSQRIWLTGASSGIGLALAEELLTAGHHLALSARRSGPLQQLSERFPGQVLLVPGDLGDASLVEAIGERIRLHWGALDMAILNAGTCEYVEAADFQAAMVERVTKNLAPGAIVLFHNNSQYITEALPIILDAILEEGYEIVPVSELIVDGEYWIDHTGKQYAGTVGGANG